MMRLFSPIHQLIAPRLQRFFANRAPRQDHVTLTLRNVYIFFSRGGLLYAVLLIITFIAGVNYANNLILGLCFYLVSVWVISVYLTFAHVSGLSLRLRQVEMAAVGEPVWVTIEVTNDKSKPSRQLILQFDKAAQASLKDTTDEMTSNSVVTRQAKSQILTSLQGTQVVRLPIISKKRGRLELPRLVVSTVYPLGIMRAWSYVYFARPAWVYPKPIAFERQEMHVFASDDERELSSHSTKGQNDFDTLGEYVEGESLARVSWAHVARGQGMLTKQFADAVGREQRLDYADMPAAHHEEKLGQLAYAVQQLGDSHEPFQLNLPNEQGDIGQGHSFVQACLLRLAKTR